MSETSPYFIAAMGLFGAWWGWAAPRIISRLPVPAAVDDEPPPDYRAIASRPFVSAQLAAAGAIVFAGLAWRAPFTSLGVCFVVAAAAIPLCYVDLQVHLLPERIIWTAAVLVLLLLLLVGIGAGEWRDLLVAVITAAVAFVLFLALALLARGGFGFGDVQLATLLALAAGSVNVGSAVLVFVLAIVTGGLVSLVLLLTRAITRRQAIAFGPFLLFGWWVAMLTTTLFAPTG